MRACPPLGELRTAGVSSGTSREAVWVRVH